MQRTDGEHAQLAKIRESILNLSEYLRLAPLPDIEASDDQWFDYLSRLAVILGNTSNHVSYVATLLAKIYLVATVPGFVPFDAAKKAMGAAGLDIDERTRDGRRVIAEIKTTVPYGASDLGSAQRSSFYKDFAKLNREEADHKFFFVTNDRTFSLMKSKYAEHIPCVRIVLLGKNEDHTFLSPRYTGSV
jgi:hypothetical protein